MKTILKLLELLTAAFRIFLDIFALLKELVRI